MRPEETGLHYNRIALRWQQQHRDSTYGVAALKMAIRFVENRSTALDIGCGSSGRFIDVLLKNRFTPTGVDISPEMISLARQLHPDVTFYVEISVPGNCRKPTTLFLPGTVLFICLLQNRNLFLRKCVMA
jgi:trans-aconitate methyltransferase